MSFKDFNLDNLENSKEILEKLLDEKRVLINELLNIENKTYKNFVLPFQEIGESINEFLTPIFHIDSVKNSEITTKVYEECLPIISKYETDISQNENIYLSLKDIQFNEKSILNDIQNKVLENEIRDFELSGCNLENNKKKRLEEINLKLSELSHKFSQNLLNATNAFEMIITNFEDVKEIPQSDLELAKFEEDGIIKYKFTLQMPSYLAYITYGTNRERREEIYKAYCTKAPENGKIIEQILALKDEKVKILGFENYAQYSLATKMAKTEDDVISFLEELGNKAKKKAKEELEEIKEIALKDGISDFRSSDMAYYSEKLKKAQYDLDEEYYRPYFEQQSVLNGFFDFLHQMFNIKFTKTQTKAWDEKVKVYDLSEDGKTIARIYIDLEARKDKRGGAWMNNWHSHFRNSNGEINLPTAYIVGNFPQSTKEIPSLLRHSDVVTLFHEMGHALHHLLSKIEEPFVSGISGVAWDTVEFPSQFLEYFSYDKDVLKLFAKHYQTGKVLNDEAIDRIIKAKNFQSSLATVRQVEFALFDFKLYQKLYKTEDEIQSLLDTIREEFAAIIPPRYNKFQNGFSHIFSGGYSAGYYSYKWAEVLSADAFYMFIDSGNIFNKELGIKYRDTILSQGGSYDMDKLFFDFAKREPSIDSLLKIEGIIS
ncbi:M3 family metallopeptidase [Aliarcobacter butzleri]|uniref:oligopeptidase A n=1 Tax=Aliarcobacter butzleri TaxID=28197 RepID=A0AAP4PXT9_9BACT|nr:M3 family metallopeptidase [Aliarcobacter butzleri]MCG3688833.1 M3 family metallopeptidase [Aliarcobacter butzleri]MCG3703339.1 M3 family metallopeptidase [Aliarcobacter butzleri]MDN5051007.1 M3 family metallopeptidase [Aliarcobacter butzleri]MDN5074334.1 M3 family metallopeptidase [Aliarcobacter butzleri]MDN5115499.1 M3 family metallopeptidase [Aliarcobacter butzleri]